MDAIYYAHTTLWVMFINLLFSIVTLWLFKLGKASNRMLIAVGLLFAGSIAFFHWGFGGQQFLSEDLSGGRFYLIILGAASAIFALLFFSASDIFNRLSQVHLQLAQGLRVFVGAGFLLEGVLLVIPGWFSIMDGFFHITSGFLALIAALAFIQQSVHSRTLLWLANLVGLLDILVIITSICFLVWEDLGPHHNMNYVIFGVGPILLWLHFNSIKKLVQS